MQTLIASRDLLEALRKTHLLSRPFYVLEVVHIISLGRKIH